MDVLANDADAEPPPKECWVQCAGYRCVAVLGSDGKWRNVSTGLVLTDFIAVCPE